jgi:small subunit ribosomal protein S8
MIKQEEQKKITNKTTNDPIADFLTRIRNAILSRKKLVRIPFSKLKMQLAELLKREGYIDDCKIVDENLVSRKSIEITLKYTGSTPVIKGLRKISKPGLRKYSKAKYAPKVFSGLGISVLTTSKGLLTDRRARKDNVGGEVICQVW